MVFVSTDQDPIKKLVALQSQIIACTACPRLVAWREQVAEEKVKRHQDETYWGKPVPSFGDPNARLLIIGLAPAAHGANRTGRLFTGDRSGDWLFRALYRAGYSNQETPVHREDGLVLTDSYIVPIVRCAPPANKPTTAEIHQCSGYLADELKLLPNIQVVVALGSIAFNTFLKVYPHPLSVKNKPKFAHGAEYSISPQHTLIASYHPSQQSTFTGRLTEAMLDHIFERAKVLTR